MNCRVLRYIIADNSLTQSSTVTFTCQDSYCMQSLVTELTNAGISFYDTNIEMQQVQLPASIWSEQIFVKIQKTLIANDMLLVMSTKQSINKLVITNTGDHIMPYCMFTMQVATWLRPCAWLCRNKKLYDVDIPHYLVQFALTEKVCKVDDYGIADWRNMQTMINDMLADTDLQNSTETIYYKQNF